MKQFAVLGLGTFGYSLAKTLYELGNDVYAIDIREDVVQSIADNVTYAVAMDMADINALRSVGIDEVDCAIIASAKDLSISLMTAINLQELGVQTVYAKARDEVQARVLRKLGVEKVIFPEQEMGTSLAHTLTDSTLLDLLQLDPIHTISEIDAPKAWHNRSLIELNIRSEHKLNVLAIKRGTETIVNPTAQEIILPDDRIIAMGERIRLAKLAQKKVSL
ncbi:MAG: TrkA family potassium uptake protein [Anaerofustis stercorihominis]|nr:TrkA family potassium uptake protein [Anaerofustis stercorihominis]